MAGGDAPSQVTPDALKIFGPSADAGENQQVGYSSVVILDGTQSFDTNGEIGGFLWEQLSGDPVSVFSANQSVATFYSPNTETTLSFVLSVFDEQGLSGKDTASVFVSSLSVADKKDGGGDGISLFPNPFNSSLSIGFFNNGNSIINSISIYNINGKKIKHWLIGVEENNNNHVLWRGKDERGFEIKSGLYFVRFEGRNKAIIKKVTYLK